jgi:hypothetical protein
MPAEKTKLISSVVSGTVLMYNQQPQSSFVGIEYLRFSYAGSLIKPDKDISVNHTEKKNVSPAIWLLRQGYGYRSYYITLCIHGRKLIFFVYPDPRGHSRQPKDSKKGFHAGSVETYVLQS